MEILTFDSTTSTLLDAEIFDSSCNRLKLPTNFVGRIYTIVSIGTDFINFSNSEIIYLISAAHVESDAFSPGNRCFVSFEYDQNMNPYTKEFEKVDKRTHICNGKFLKLNQQDYMLYIHLIKSIQSQGVRVLGCLYSINNDLIAFVEIG